MTCLGISSVSETHNIKHQFNLSISFYSFCHQRNIQRKIDSIKWEVRRTTRVSPIPGDTHVSLKLGGINLPLMANSSEKNSPSSTVQPWHFWLWSSGTSSWNPHNHCALPFCVGPVWKETIGRCAFMGVSSFKISQHSTHASEPLPDIPRIMLLQYIFFLCSLYLQVKLYFCKITRKSSGQKWSNSVKREMCGVGHNFHIHSCAMDTNFPGKVKKWRCLRKAHQSFKKSLYCFQNALDCMPHLRSHPDLKLPDKLV